MSERKVERRAMAGNEGLTERSADPTLGNAARDRREHAEELRDCLFGDAPTAGSMNSAQAAELVEALFSPRRGPRTPLYPAGDSEPTAAGSPTPKKLGFVEQLVKFFGR